MGPWAHCCGAHSCSYGAGADRLVGAAAMPVVLLRAQADQMLADFWGMGLEPHALSAITGTGTGEMLDAMAAVLPRPSGGEQDEGKDGKPLSVAIVGRPNVGEFAWLCGGWPCGKARGKRKGLGGGR